jgi:toxin-antitoxin system PIN domain toxin
VSISLLDVNVLVSLLDPAHVQHERAHQWFARNQKNGWATCPITVNGCVRVLSNPAYPTVEASAAEVISHLGMMCTDAHHDFWPDAVSLLDQSLFPRPFLYGHRVLTDLYLLGLAVNRHGKLVTFDGGIPWRAVTGASPRHLELVD